MKNDFEFIYVCRENESYNVTKYGIEVITNKPIKLIAIPKNTMFRESVINDFIYKYHNRAGVNEYRCFIINPESINIDSVESLKYDTPYFDKYFITYNESVKPENLNYETEYYRFNDLKNSSFQAIANDFKNMLLQQKYKLEPSILETTKGKN